MKQGEFIFSPQEREVLRKIQRFLDLWQVSSYPGRASDPYTCANPTRTFLVPIWNTWSEHPRGPNAKSWLPKAKRDELYQLLKGCDHCLVELNLQGWRMFFTQFVVTELTSEEQKTFRGLKRHFEPFIPYRHQVSGWKEYLEILKGAKTNPPKPKQ